MFLHITNSIVGKMHDKVGKSFRVVTFRLFGLHRICPMKSYSEKKKRVTRKLFFPIFHTSFTLIRRNLFGIQDILVFATGRHFVSGHMFSSFTDVVSLFGTVLPPTICSVCFLIWAPDFSEWEMHLGLA